MHINVYVITVGVISGSGTAYFNNVKVNDLWLATGTSGLAIGHGSAATTINGTTLTLRGSEMDYNLGAPLKSTDPQGNSDELSFSVSLIEWHAYSRKSESKT